MCFSATGNHKPAATNLCGHIVYAGKINSVRVGCTSALQLQVWVQPRRGFARIQPAFPRSAALGRLFPPWEAGAEAALS